MFLPTNNIIKICYFKQRPVTYLCCCLYVVRGRSNGAWEASQGLQPRNKLMLPPKKSHLTRLPHLEMGLHESLPHPCWDFVWHDFIQTLCMQLPQGFIFNKRAKKCRRISCCSLNNWCILHILPRRLHLLPASYRGTLQCSSLPFEDEIEEDQKCSVTCSPHKPIKQLRLDYINMFDFKH